MGLTNSQLDQVMREYDRRQLADQADQTARIRYAMEKVPDCGNWIRPSRIFPWSAAARS